MTVILWGACAGKERQASTLMCCRCLLLALGVTQSCCPCLQPVTKWRSISLILDAEGGFLDHESGRRMDWICQSSFTKAETPVLVLSFRFFLSHSLLAVYKNPLVPLTEQHFLPCYVFVLSVGSWWYFPLNTAAPCRFLMSITGSELTCRSRDILRTWTEQTGRPKQELTWHRYTAELRGENELKYTTKHA